MILPTNLLFCRDEIAETLRRILAETTFSRLCVLVDENTLKHCYPLVRDSLPDDHVVIEIENGEEHKNLETCTTIWRTMTRHKLDRHAILINLGGGVIGDMGGFCAAAYKRGIAFINIPTTLLAQVDASIGGKLGIDFDGLKNHIGLFSEPARVVIYPGFLETLSERELRSGFAEVIKHALIRDAAHFGILQKHTTLQHVPWTDIIAHSVEIKQKVVEADPLEHGLRKILNFGHTIGHGIESYFLGHGKHKLLHGEAIAIGMICEAYLSVKKLNLPPEALQEIAVYILKLYDLPVLEAEAIRAVAGLAVQDKKNMGCRIRASLLERIGCCSYDVDISANEIMESIQAYNDMLS
jgi:3-dehydroquinate synthase